MDLEATVPEPGYRWDVGERLGRFAALGISHPAYQKIAGMVSRRVDEMARAEQLRRGKAHPGLLCVALRPAQSAALLEEYPELRVTIYPLRQPGHLVYEAHRQLANQLLLLRASKYAGSAVFLGGTAMSSLVTGMVVHNETDAKVPAAVHSRISDMQLMHRLMADYAKVQHDTGMVGLQSRYDRYVSTRGFSCDGSGCEQTAGAYLVDLSMFARSPLQVAVGALQADADIVHGYLPYDPIMLMVDSGEIPGTGIWFEKDYDRNLLVLKYPEGAAGAQSWNLSDWASWLGEHSVDIGVGPGRAQYHLQLLKGRGPFLFWDMVRVREPTDTVSIRHALELPLGEPCYVISGWKLKSLAHDVLLRKSWEPVVFTASRKVVDAVFAFGMQLKPDAFTRAAVAQQLRRLDRVTVEGSTVVKGFSPSVEQLDLLTTMIHCELFVRRYEAGSLSSALMSQLKSVMGFSGASLGQRLRAYTMWTLISAWDATVGAAVDGLVSFGLWFEKWLAGTGPELPTFDLAPKRLLMETVVGGWRSEGFKQLKAVLGYARSEALRNPCSGRGDSLVRTMAASQAQARMRSVHVRALASFQTQLVGADGHEPVLSSEAHDDLREALFSKLAASNELDEPSHNRMDLELQQAVREELSAMQIDQDVDEDFVGTMNEVTDELHPGMTAADLDQDLASITYSDQDRFLVADKLRIPRISEAVPKDRAYYRSKLLALGAPNRQETGPELLSAVAARNLAAPKLSIPQDEGTLFPDIWEKFLDNMCIPEARERLRKYKEDPVALEQGAYRDWMAKATPDALRKVARDMEESSRCVLDADLSEYLVMLKADVKPPLSDKPLRQRTEPQVIVYHNKLVSSAYSSILRVLVRRFLSLLKPNVHVNLTKDLGDIRGFVQACHPFGDRNLQYLENDFSKYDKSQDAFAFGLEEFVFRELGMNEEFLQRWVVGHEDCKLRSFVTGLCLHLRFQRKSGDASTAFGNVLYNILSTNYCYDLSNIKWALYMGDDSLICMPVLGLNENAVKALAEMFNLTAKTYVTDAPYFASTFFLFDEDFREVVTLPDPVKRIEKWSKPVSAEDPQWEERYTSAADTCRSYSYKRYTEQLAARVAERYPLSLSTARRLPAAVYTAISSVQRFRDMYQEAVEIFRY